MVKKTSCFKRAVYNFYNNRFQKWNKCATFWKCTNLFQEEKGVAEGIMKDKNYFIADKILKHDENYMPPGVRSLENNLLTSYLGFYALIGGLIISTYCL